jgi:lipoyl(octanoyl) transferase
VTLAEPGHTMSHRALTAAGARSLSTQAPRGHVELWRLGRAPYWEVWSLQRALHAQRTAASVARQQQLSAAPDPPDVLLSVEHTATYTLGGGATLQGLRFDAAQFLADPGAFPFRVFRVDRGGQVTWHGPGQIVLYPILDLSARPQWKKDLSWYVHLLEEATIRTMTGLGVACARLAKYPGVWTEQNRKIAAIGARASRWITMHGLAINVDCDLSEYDRIVPCGIVGKEVTSLAFELTADGKPCPSREVVEHRAVSVLEELLETRIEVNPRVVDLDSAIHECGEALFDQARAELELECQSRLCLIRAGTSKSGDLRD